MIRAHSLLRMPNKNQKLKTSIGVGVNEFVWYEMREIETHHSAPGCVKHVV
jgi:hypothetical protein